MCATCGCGPGQVSIEGGKAPHGVAHGHDHHGDDHAHHHAHGHSHSHSHAHDHAPASAPEAGVSARTLVLERDILAENNRFAAENRRVFARTGTLALNLMSSPGAGKTSLLVETLKALGPVPAVVIEGDQQTTNDAERIRATGRQAVQINTGKGCHLDAHMVGHALERLTLEKRGLVFIENVGNLVCPAAFDLGEARRVVLFSVTEGEDKPLKYPDMFAIADVVVITKTDLAPHVEADVAAMKAHVARINPAAIVLETSIRGAGLAPWLDWLIAERRAMAEAERARLAGELAALEADLSADRPATPVAGA